MVSTICCPTVSVPEKLCITFSNNAACPFNNKSITLQNSGLCWLASGLPYCFASIQFCCDATANFTLKFFSAVGSPIVLLFGIGGIFSFSCYPFLWHRTRAQFPLAACPGCTNMTITIVAGACP